MAQTVCYAAMLHVSARVTEMSPAGSPDVVITDPAQIDSAMAAGALGDFKITYFIQVDSLTGDERGFGNLLMNIPPLAVTLSRTTYNGQLLGYEPSNATAQSSGRPGAPVFAINGDWGGSGGLDLRDIIVGLPARLSSDGTADDGARNYRLAAISDGPVPIGSIWTTFHGGTFSLTPSITGWSVSVGDPSQLVVHPGGIDLSSATVAFSGGSPVDTRPVWVNPTVGGFSTPSNWSTGSVPGPTDEVLFYSGEDRGVVLSSDQSNQAATFIGGKFSLDLGGNEYHLTGLVSAGPDAMRGGLVVSEGRASLVGAGGKLRVDRELALRGHLFLSDGVHAVTPTVKIGISPDRGWPVLWVGGDGTLLECERVDISGGFSTGEFIVDSGGTARVTGTGVDGGIGIGSHPDSSGRVAVYDSSRLDVLGSVHVGGGWTETGAGVRGGQGWLGVGGVASIGRGLTIWEDSAATISGTLRVDGGTRVRGRMWVPGDGTITTDTLVIDDVPGAIVELDTGGTVTVTTGPVEVAGILRLSHPSSSLSVQGVVIRSTGSLVLTKIHTFDARLTPVTSEGLIDVIWGKFIAAAGALGGRLHNADTVAGPSAAGQVVTFTGPVSGPGAFTGRIAFADTYSPGDSVASVTLESTTFLPTSTLVMELGTPAASDEILFRGNGVAFDGTLRVVPLDTFSPAHGLTFDLFDGPLSGTFHTLQLPPLPGNFTWDTSSLYTTGTLGILPEPHASLSFAAAAAAALLQRGRRRSGAPHGRATRTRWIAGSK